MLGNRLENSPPVRRVATYKGQRNFSGLWWCPSTNRYVGFESWLERDHLIRLDFDPTVTGIASQPFRIKFPKPLPQIWHVPDYFVRRVDGTSVVVDVRPDAKVKTVDQLAFDATAELCATAGWDCRRLEICPDLFRIRKGDSVSTKERSMGRSLLRWPS
ncbi:TnsA-like heteromeric transposase endonuclease subunit [Paeniglutamicibacter sp. ORCA_105]|uniref:TnsA-like heteromeric transposase endonuclease subunit n=1 Tax=Paeniglutamicibacter sp. ORCA_105 TaxID=3377336 RepID=UPI003893E139